MTIKYINFVKEMKRQECQKFFAYFLQKSASEQRAKVFCLEQTKFVKTKTEDPFNANEQDSKRLWLSWIERSATNRKVGGSNPSRRI